MAERAGFLAVPHPRWLPGCLLLALGLANGACDSPRSDARAGEPDSLASLSRDLGVALPKETAIVGVERQRGMDDMVRAKVRIPRASYPAFRGRVPVPEAAMEADAGALLGTGPSWWRPRPSAQVGQAPIGHGRVLHVGVDDTGSGDVIVYLMQHGT